MTIPSVDETLLNVGEAATIIGCTEGRVRQMLRDGTISGKKANERAWLIPKSEANRIADSQPKTGRPRSGR